MKEVECASIFTATSRHLFGSKSVLCAGWFDLFHVGHLEFFLEAKKEARSERVIPGKLIVLVMNDKDGALIKGPSRPVIPEQDRLEIVRNIKAVDWAMLCPFCENPDPCPKGLTVKSRLLWNRYLPIINSLRPDKVLALEETFEPPLREYITSLGVELVFTPRNKGVSTTEIEQKIIRSASCRGR